MASGRQPWSEEGFENPFSLLFRIATSDDLPVIPTTLGMAGERFVRRCLERDADKRPSASDLLQDDFILASMTREEAAMVAAANKEKALDATTPTVSCPSVGTARDPLQEGDIVEMEYKSLPAALSLPPPPPPPPPPVNRLIDDSSGLRQNDTTNARSIATLAASASKVAASKIARPVVGRDSARQVAKRLYAHRRAGSGDSKPRQLDVPSADQITDHATSTVALIAQQTLEQGRQPLVESSKLLAPPTPPSRRKQSPNSPER